MKSEFEQSNIRTIDLPPYPKAFISTARLSRERDRVFVAMPFDAIHSDVLWKIIRGVCDIHGLNVRRADSSVYPNPIVADILDELERAEIVIADLTGLNPNVLYEVGIAHVRCDSVVLVCKRGQILPFDLGNIRCIFFDFDQENGRVEFADRLGKTLNALKAIGPPIVITSQIDRTIHITRDLQRLSNLSDEELTREIVWYSGFLSSFAISKDEKFPPEGKELHRLLLDEKDAMTSLARRECLIRCIITPPSAEFLMLARIEYALDRVINLLKFLESNDPALKYIEWAVSPYQQKNLYIIGRISCFEGFRKEVHSGYALTLRQTGLAVASNTSLYEALFERLVEDILRPYQNEKIENRRDILRKETIKYLSESKEYLESLKNSRNPQN